MRPYPYNQIRDIELVKEILAYRKAETPDKDVFRIREDKDSYRSVKWAQFAEDVDALGAALYKRGLKGAHLCVMGENSYEWLLAFMTALCGNIVIVPLDRELGKEKIAELIRFSDADGIVFSKTYAPMMEEIKAGLPDVGEFICMEEHNGFASISELKAEGAKLLAEGDRTYVESVPGRDDLSAIYFTSGTSGDQKGVMLSQRNIVASFHGACQHVHFTEDDVFLSVLPLHHAYESNCGILAILHWGGIICFNESLKLFMSNLRLFQPTAMSLVPLITVTMFRQIMDGARKSGKIKKLQAGMKLSDLLMKINIDVTDRMFGEVYEAFGGRFKKAFVGGAPLNPVITKAFRQLGIVLLQGYGITECAPLVSVNREGFHKDDSVGPVLPVCRVKISEGEILVKGDNVMLGYYKNEQATKESMEGGWFKTGDLGYIDMDGFLYVTGRKKNLIILDSGENISPEELEGYIINLPLVKEVVVYGDDNKITAEIYPDNEYAESKQIEDIEGELKRQIEDINKGLPRYKHISGLKLRETEFEKTTSKKIIRYKVNGGSESV